MITFGTLTSLKRSFLWKIKFLACTLLTSLNDTSGRWESVAELVLPYYAYRDMAGNFGLHDLDLSLYVGQTVYMDNDLGKVCAANAMQTQSLLKWDTPVTWHFGAPPLPCNLLGQCLLALASLVLWLNAALIFRSVRSSCTGSCFEMQELLYPWWDAPHFFRP